MGFVSGGPSDSHKIECASVRVKLRLWDRFCLGEGDPDFVSGSGHRHVRLLKNQNTTSPRSWDVAVCLWILRLPFQENFSSILSKAGTTFYRKGFWLGI